MSRLLLGLDGVEWKGNTDTDRTSNTTSNQWIQQMEPRRKLLLRLLTRRTNQTNSSAWAVVGTTSFESRGRRCG